jgi:hypothetical protein
MREYLDELRDNWTDSYWRADHPEVMAVLVAVLTGVIGLTFALIEIHLRQAQLPTARN